MIFNKNKNIQIRLIPFSLVFCMLIACDDFLDVRPKSEIPADIHFERESGYFDQLTGVYSNMCSEVLYGRQMTFGLVEVLSQNYDLKADNPYRYVAEYDYKNSSVQAMTDAIWTSAYNCIANLNLMLQYIDEVDRSIFTDDNYRIYKGEALGLRGFLHFDMLRLYAPAYASNSSVPAIPYVIEYSPTVTPQYTVTEAMDLIIKDLTEAAELLLVDPLRIAERPYDYWERRAYFNYYAAVGTLARVYLYKGDYQNALKYAEIIIEENEKFNSAFTWTDETALAATQDHEVNRLFTTEMIFHLDYTKMETVINSYFKGSLDTYLTLSETKADVIYEKSSKGYGDEWRMYRWFTYDGGVYMFSKFWQYENSRYNKYFPVIRMTEAYYIASEVLRDSNPERAVSLLNDVRSHRNLKEYPLDYTLLTAEDIMTEIQKEYRKEFLGEGQYFYFYKRLNYDRIEGAAVVANNNIYVLPMPDNEVEFGDRD